MPISLYEQSQLRCPNCGTTFNGEVWTLVDAEERPDLAAAIAAGTLNQVICPACGVGGTASSPLLFHDPANRRVYFAVPPATDAHRWREQAQALLYVLVGELPEERRGLYLGDVQVEEGLDGVQRAIARHTRRTQRTRAAIPTPPGTPVHVPEPVAIPATPPPEAAPETSAALLDAVQEFLAADTPAEAQALAARRPILTDPAADLLLVDLVRMADTQGEREIARAINEARVLLRELRSGAPLELPPEPEVPNIPADQAATLSDAAYQALLSANSPEQLAGAIRAFPALLDPWADADLSARVDTALHAGHELLAATLEERRAALSDLRADLTSEPAVLDAVRLLLDATDQEAISTVLMQYPALLTEVTQRVMMELAAGARAQGDDALAAYTIECRAMLRSVRVGLEEDSQ